MKKPLGTLLILFIFAGPLAAADPVSPAPGKVNVKFPTPTVPPQPVPAGYPRLTADRLFVVEADAPCFLKALPSNLVTVTADEGPIRIKGKFADGGEKVETRTYKGKHVFTIEAAGTGRVELLFIPVGVQKESDIVSATVDVDNGEAPRPPPGPADPLAPLLAAAFTLDGRPLADAKALAAVYREGVPLAADGAIRTAGELLKVMHAAAERVCPLPKLAGTRDLLAKELNAKLETKDGPLDAAGRRAAADQFARIAALLEALK